MDMELIRSSIMSTLRGYCIHHHTYVIYWQAQSDDN